MIVISNLKVKNDTKFLNGPESDDDQGMEA